MAVITVAMPAAAIKVPATARTTEVAERSTATSRSAASGATRDALSAGVMLATSVVTTPTAAAMTIVSTPRTSPAVGRSRPAPSIRASRPVARPSPMPMPMAEATIPMASASPVTDVRIWRREAPIARSSADSRVRWATRIENVLWMLNVATIRAMPANASRMIWKKPRKSLSMSACCSAISSSWASASMRAGISSAISSRRLSALTPSSAATSTAEMPSGRLASRSRAASSVKAV